MKKFEVEIALSVGVDVGGTFTDVVVSHPGGAWRAKTPTTHGEIGRGVLAGLALAAEQAGTTLPDMLAQVERFGLGTTAVTNVIAEVRGARVGLLTTAGFEGELNLARGIRFSIDGPVRAPDQIVPRQLIAGLNERIDRAGKVLRALDPSEAVSAVERLVQTANAETIVVSLVNSYRNPAHEELAVSAIQKHFPGMKIISAAALNGTFGFLQRTMFAVLNGFAGAAFAGVDDLVEQLRGLGLKVPLRLVNSTGGTVGVEGARRTPLLLMQSGPAGGVAAAASLASRAGMDRVLACDMGGTSFDISVVNHGAPLRRLNAEILRVPTGLSMVDVDSIGAGGGSIGWADMRGMLRVGPQSAGSNPGPACYGWGGTEPTVTDALVVLGYIDPANFLGGKMKLDREAAVTACARLGEKLNLSADAAAWGIRRLALANMVRTAQVILNRRGLDAREYTIISYGGCGGLFNGDIARSLGITKVLVPHVASVFSAFGAATAPVLREQVRAVVREFPLPADLIAATLEELRLAVLEDLKSDLVPIEDCSVSFEAALRFKRQPSELPVPVPGGLPASAIADVLLDDFRKEYAKRYGESAMMLGAPIELVTLRAIGRGKAQVIETTAERLSGVASSLGNGARRVLLELDAERAAVKSINGSDLFAGAKISGPACIDGVDTTIWIPPHSTATVDRDLSILIELDALPSAIAKKEAA